MRECSLSDFIKASIHKKVPSARLGNVSWHGEQRGFFHVVINGNKVLFNKKGFCNTYDVDEFTLTILMASPGYRKGVGASLPVATG